MRNCLLFLALAGAGALAATAAVDPNPNWRRAVDQYVGAAHLETTAYHQQIDAAPPAEAPRYKDAKADLEQCDRLLGQLGSTDPQHFDGLKGKYEQARARLADDLKHARE